MTQRERILGESDEELVKRTAKKIVEGINRVDKMHERAENHAIAEGIEFDA